MSGFRKENKYAKFLFRFCICSLLLNGIWVFAHAQPAKPKSLSAPTRPAGPQADDTAQHMDEVIITGFQNVDKRRFSGAVTTIKGSDVKMEGMTDVSRMLEGRVAGVSIQQVSGTFGAAPKVRIRGATSLTGDNKPLWVVDGVILEDPVNISNDQLSSGDPATLIGSAIAGLNANDIANFTVLKDASATALYGARAMNGVVVITTKKGRSGTLAVNYSVNLSTNLKPSYRNFNILDSRSQVDFYRELQNKGWLNYTDISLRPDAGIFGKLADYVNTWDPVRNRFSVENTPEGRQKFLERYADANTDWFDVLFRNQLIQEHSLSISGGSGRAQNYLSLSFYGDDGWTIADKVKRYTLNFKNNYKVNSQFSFWINPVVSFRQQRTVGSAAREPERVRGEFSREFDINPFSYALNTSRALTPYDENGNLEFFRKNNAPFNIINEIRNNFTDLSLIDAKIQGGFSVKLYEGLTFESLAMIRYVGSSSEQQIHSDANQILAYRAANSSTIRRQNQWLFTPPEKPDADPEVVLADGGILKTRDNSLTNWDVRNTLTYTKTLDPAEKHYINALAGWNIRSIDRASFSNDGFGYQFDKGGVVATDYRLIRKNMEAGSPYFSRQTFAERFVAFFSTVSYSYDSRVNLSLNARVDGANKLGASPRARWTPTYSASIAYNIDRERFMQYYRQWVSSLRLRFSYGLTASLGTADNAQAVYRNKLADRPDSRDRETIATIDALENRDLTWEKLNTYNWGVDAGFFSNRITLTADVYFRKSFDLINRIPVSGIGGELIKSINFADMNSYGGEVTIGSTPVAIEGGIKWNTTFSLGINKTKITRAQNVPNIFSLVAPEGFYRLGYPVRGLFSLRNQGLNPQTGRPLFINELGQKSEKVYLQSTSVEHLQYEGPVDPVYTGGYNNTISYAGFSLNIFITFQAGNKIRLNPIFKQQYTDLDATPVEFVTRFQAPNNHTNTPVISDPLYNSRGSDGYPYNNYNFSHERVVSGNFIRLKTISLSYTVPQNLVKIARIKGLNFMLSVYNLALLYADSRLNGQDPEFFNTGGVALPIAKTITLTTRVSF